MTHVIQAQGRFAGASTFDVAGWKPVAYEAFSPSTYSTVSLSKGGDPFQAKCLSVEPGVFLLRIRGANSAGAFASEVLAQCNRP